MGRQCATHFASSERIFNQQLQYFYFTDETDPGEEGDGDSVDGGLGFRSKLKTKAYKMTIYWVSFLDQQQRVVLFTQDPRVAEAARMVSFKSRITDYFKRFFLMDAVE